MKRRDILMTGVAGTALSGFPAIVRAQPAYRAEYKLSTVVGPQLSLGKAGENFANFVREATKGRINFKQYPGSSLVQGQQDREFTAVRQGTIDVLVSAPMNWAGTIRECGAFTLPFLIPDHKAFDAVVASDVVQKDFFNILRKAGGEPLAVGEIGFRQLTNSKRVVRKPEDLRGLKIRTVASPMYSDIFSSMGANPTAMSWADAQPALASGAVDGQENPMEVFLALKINQLGQKFVTKWNYSNDLALFMVAGSIWQTWAPEDQRLVREAAQEAAKLYIRQVRESYAGDVEQVRAMGVNVVVPTAAEKEAWQVATRRAYARWKAQVGADLITKIEEVVARSRKA